MSLPPLVVPAVAAKVGRPTVFSPPLALPSGRMLTSCTVAGSPASKEHS